MMYTTQQQAIQTITDLLKNHGYNPRDYDVLSIADEYKQEHGNYGDVAGHPWIVWAYIEEYGPEQTTDHAPANFAPRDWDAPEHDNTAPRDRFEVYDGPAHGGTTTHWEPDWGVGVNIDGYCDVGQGITMRLDAAHQLRDDLTAVLDKLDQ